MRTDNITSGLRRNITRRILLAALLAALPLTGCAPKLPDAPGTAPQTESKEAEAAEFTAAVFYYDYSDNYVSAVRRSMNQLLVRADLAYHEYDAASSQSTQNAQIDEAIDSGVNLLIVNIVSSGSANTTDAICMKASRAGVPVIFFNRSIEDDGDEGVILNYYEDVAFVGTDPAEAGHLQGKLIGSYLKSHYEETDLNKDGKISYALFKGEARNAEAIYRTKYAVEDADAILKEAGYPDLEYFDRNSVDPYQLDLTGKWSLTAVRDYMLTNLSEYSEDNGNMIELVICNSDTMAEGAIRALETYGYNLKTAGSRTIPVFGVDASAGGRSLIAEGKMTGTIRQDAEGMAACIVRLSENVKRKKDMLDGTDEYARDTEHGLQNKLYIPYTVYEAEADSGLPLDGGTDSSGSHAD